eukprot:Protomagalhaensia_sp_Gyna_25__1600@NODE_1826_length_1497_cov_67_981481_g1501_i0_p1_GENE_NODE_1826_length_1497_cov_67_981481_g1501_i0NODE_1826_length_1497_cov_67_981481_g1501_i0_p1_ORF_typecomplete_len247_score22_58_NODE_1826_length_1497_cov_67_981481_g1501_i0126866
MTTLRLRDRLLSSLSKNVAILPETVATSRPPFTVVDTGPPLSSNKADDPLNQPAATTSPLTSPRLDHTPTKTKHRTNVPRRGKRDQPQRLLKKLPQAKVLGDVNLEELLQENDLVVLLHDDQEDDTSSTSYDASVPEERQNSEQRGPIKSALWKSSSHKLSKKTAFVGGDVEGREVTAIYLYEAVHVELPSEAEGHGDLLGHDSGMTKRHRFKFSRLIHPDGPRTGTTITDETAHNPVCPQEVMVR